MYNFEFQNPTKLIFGKGTIAQLATEIPADKKIMLTFGGGSVKSNGVYDQVVAALSNHNTIEFWGIEPNPQVETLRKAIKLGKENNIDYLVAVGGGSTLDGTKLISAAIWNENEAWDIVLNESLVDKVVPYATVLTLPATGSEMNNGAVISNKATDEKYPFYSSFPQVSILDPETTYTLPKYQVACGLADTFVHTVEQYMTVTNQSPLMDRWAEGILSTLIEIAPKIKEDQTNYDNMANFMLCATMALNGFTAMGVSQDWATHLIGHEVTALHGITHGETLAIIYPALLDVMREQKGEKILQFGERVFGVKNNDKEAAIDETIAKTKEFFLSLGLRGSLSEAGAAQESIEIISERFNSRGSKMGEKRNITGEVAKVILSKCF